VQKKKFTKVKISNINSQQEDIITTMSFDFNSQGVSEALSYVQPDLTYDPKILDVKSHTIEVFFDEIPEKDFFEELKKIAPYCQYEVLHEDHKDWLEEWKKGFEPFQLVHPYWIVPSWRPTPEGVSKVIQIDPGMAFGTGTHATTKMASYFIVKEFKNRNQNIATNSKTKAIKTVIDVGAGTGILSMLAKMEGAKSVLCVEIDPEARRVCRENIERNKLSEVEVTNSPLEDIKEKFDLVVANIIDGVLIQIQDQLLQVMTETSTLFVTGILREREDHFLTHFIEPNSFDILQRIELDEWVGFGLKLKNT